MVSASSALSVCMLLLSSFAVARNMDDNTGPITKAMYDTDSDSMNIYRAPADAAAPTAAVVEKRAYSSYDPKLVSLLYSKKQWDFCKAYVNLRPTVTKYATVTTCGYGQKCIPTTITTMVSLTVDTTAVVTGEASTFTIESTATEMSTVFETVANPTLTSTVGRALETGGGMQQRRYVRVPSYLNRYKSAQISAACSELVKNAIHTKTKTATKTIRGRPTTATQTVMATATNTAFTTTIPVMTITAVVATTTATTTETTTTIATICPAPHMRGVQGITSTPGISLRIVSSTSTSEVGCCSACYELPGGCAAYYWWRTGFCAVAVSSSGADASSQCPTGKGFVKITTGAAIGDGSAGPGPCYTGTFPVLQ